MKVVLEVGGEDGDWFCWMVGGDETGGKKLTTQSAVLQGPQSEFSQVSILAKKIKYELILHFFHLRKIILVFLLAFLQKNLAFGTQIYTRPSLSV